MLKYGLWVALREFDGSQNPAASARRETDGRVCVSKRRKYQKIKRGLHVVVILCFSVFVIAFLIFGASWLERRERKPEIKGDYRQRFAYDNLVEVGGVSYRQRKDLTTILLMGIDQDSDRVRVGARRGGQADFIRLLVIDPDRETVTQLAIDRDTMTPITVLGILGDVASTRTLQICLSHGYGDGKEQSCEFTVEAVSNLLLGSKIDFYAAMNLDGIHAMNDWVGGVTMTLTDDYSMIDPEMKPGATLTLTGEQAEVYVRQRMEVSDGTNASRMNRQEEYLELFGQKAREKWEEDKQKIGELYDVIAPYLTTNLARGRIINEAWKAKDYTLEEAVTLPGTHSIGSDGYVEYHVDNESLQQIVLDMLYEKVE